MVLEPLARTGDKYRAATIYEGVIFVASGDTQETANERVIDEVAYQMCRRAKGYRNRLDGTL